MPAVGIDVEGLDELRAQLREAGGSKLTRELGKANKAGATVVADEARGRAESLGGSAAKGADTIKPSASAKASSVNLGGARAPWMAGAEFGALAFAQFPDWKGNQWSPDSGNVGYFLHPAIRDTKDEFLEVYGDAIDDLMARAFPD